MQDPCDKHFSARKFGMDSLDDKVVSDSGSHNLNQCWTVQQGVGCSAVAVACRLAVSVAIWGSGPLLLQALT